MFSNIMESMFSNGVDVYDWVRIIWLALLRAGTGVPEYFTVKLWMVGHAGNLNDVRGLQVPISSAVTDDCDLAGGMPHKFIFSHVTPFNVIMFHKLIIPLHQYIGLLCDFENLMLLIMASFKIPFFLLVFSALTIIIWVHELCSLHNSEDEQAVTSGRPKLDINVGFLRTLQFSFAQILGISRSTLYRRLDEDSWSCHS